MKDTKKKVIHRMEVEDDQGILRKKQNKVMKLKTFRIIKYVLIGLIPAAYFIYSPLLLPFCLCYAVLYFIARSIEKGTNRNLKKEYCISIPKFDSVFAFMAILITCVGVILNFTSTTMKGGMFEGKTDEEITAELEEKGMSDSMIEGMLSRMDNDSVSRIWQKSKNALTLLSGERVFFTSTESFGGGGDSRMGEPPEGSESGDFTPPNDMGGSGMMDMASNIPFDRIFTQIASSVNTVVIFLIPLSGLLTIYIMRKL